jgi:hypothetical protein
VIPVTQCSGYSRPRSKGEAIAAAWAAFARCQFDKGDVILGCGGSGPTARSGTRAGGVEGPPRDDDASHGADAFLTFACSNYTPPSSYVPPKGDTRWVV